MRLAEQLPHVELYQNFWAHGLIALGLLFVSERLGKLLVAYRDDYQPISSLFQVESSVGFNALYRVLFTPLCVVGISIVLYLVNLDWVVVNIWAVAVWFAVLQATMILIGARWALVHTIQFFVFHALSVAISYFLYEMLIKNGLSRLLPDEANLRTDLWLIVILFLYGLFQAVRRNGDTSKRTRYALKRAKKFRRKYADVFQKYEPGLQDILLSVMIFEDFNRPYVARVLENITKAHTRTIMQVPNASTDEDGIIATAKVMMPLYETYKVIPNAEPIPKNQALRAVFGVHNPDAYDYTMRVEELYNDIKREGIQD